MRLLGALLLVTFSQTAAAQLIPSVSNPFGRTVVRTQPGVDFQLQEIPEWAWTISPALFTSSNVNVGILNISAERGPHTFQTTLSHADIDGADNLWEGQLDYTFNAIKSERWAVDTTLSVTRTEATATSYAAAVGAVYLLAQGDAEGVGNVTLVASAGWAQQNPDAKQAETADDARLSAGIGWRATKKLSLRAERSPKNDVDGASAWTGTAAYGPAVVRYTQGGKWLVAWSIPLP